MNPGKDSGNNGNSDHRRDGFKPGGTGGQAIEGQTGLRYSRERRLSNAAPEVRWLASRYGAKRPGFLKALFATRSSALLFITIVGLAIAFFIAPLLQGGSSESGAIGQARFSASALFFEGRILVALHRVGGGAEDEAEGLVVLASIGGAAAKRFEFPFGSGPSSDYRFALDVAAEKPRLVNLKILGVGGELKLSIPVE